MKESLEAKDIRNEETIVTIATGIVSPHHLGGGLGVETWIE